MISTTTGRSASRWNQASLVALVTGSLAIGVSAAEPVHPDLARHASPDAVKASEQTESAADAYQATDPVTRPAAHSTLHTAALSATHPVVRKAYRVRPHDTLSGIARTVLGDSARFEEIFALNRAARRLTGAG